VHYGGRLLSLPDGSWLLTSGDGFDYREQAQVRTSHLGKVLRFTGDGRPVSSPPWPESPYLFTMGHRNPQAIVWDEGQQSVWLHEHGPAGGDELNRIVAGGNYGWPLVTQGKDYSGANITPFSVFPNTVLPVLNWTPSIAPSGMTLYSHTLFPNLQGKLLITTLKAQHLFAVDTQSPVSAEPLFDTLKTRLRDVAVGRDGAIYVITDEEDARLLRVSPH
jgi:glucose/arabinose dehydrogenase